MKKFLKLISLSTVVLIIASMMFTACNRTNKTEKTTREEESPKPTEQVEKKPEIDTTKYARLKMYFLGNKPEDMDMVWAEINKLLKEKINAEIEPALMSWGDWSQRYPLIFASGEEWDMIYTANWAMYAQQASKGGFLELTEEMLKKYAPLTFADLPREAWTTTRVKGKNYMIPQGKRSKYGQHFGLIVRGDLREKYGLPEIKNVQDLEVFMDAVLKNEKDMVPLADVGKTNTHMLLRALFYHPNLYTEVVDGVGTLLYNYADRSQLKTVPAYELDGFVDYMKKMIEWRKRGYWSRSALTHQGRAIDLIREGKGAVSFGHINNALDVYNHAREKQPNWKIEYVDLTEGRPLPSQGYLGNGSAIHAASKNPDRALMALDLLGYDPEINYLVLEGIPGVHSINKGTNEERRIERLKTTYSGGSYSVWGFANFVTLPINSFPTYEKLFYSYVKQLSDHPIAGMTLDTEDIKNEIAATTQVIDSYKTIINLGFSDDAEKTLKKYIEELKAAGIEKVDAAIKAQAEVLFQQNK